MPVVWRCADLHIAMCTTGLHSICRTVPLQHEEKVWLMCVMCHSANAVWSLAGAGYGSSSYMDPYGAMRSGNTAAMTPEESEPPHSLLFPLPRVLHLPGEASILHASDSDATFSPGSSAVTSGAHAYMHQVASRCRRNRFHRWTHASQAEVCPALSWQSSARCRSSS